MTSICSNKLGTAQYNITEHQTILDTIETGTAPFTALKHFDIVQVMPSDSMLYNLHYAIVF